MPKQNSGVAHDPDDLLTAAEACRYLKISRRTFCRLREQHRLPAPMFEASRTLMRWRRGDLLTAVAPVPSPATLSGRALAAGIHIRAAVQKFQAATRHAEEAAAVLRQLAVELVIPGAVTADASADAAFSHSE